MKIEMLQRLLEAEYLCDLPSGHAGARLMRFRRNRDNTLFIVKYAPRGNGDCGEDAMRDLEANIYGYSRLKELGVEKILPLELREVQVENGRALVMRDAGKTMRQADLGFAQFEWFWEHFSFIAASTARKNASERSSSYEDEIVRHIERFAPAGSDIASIVNRRLQYHPLKNVSLMLLDLTPDNVFVSPGRLFFIDPWSQCSYLGNPAVSIGQLTTLVRLYRLRDSERGSMILEEGSRRELPEILDCSPEAIDQGLLLGKTLQLNLSAYVRRDSDPERAEELLRQAESLWQ